jgi:hypothetical protein
MNFNSKGVLPELKKLKLDTVIKPFESEDEELNDFLH